MRDRFEHMMIDLSVSEARVQEGVIMAVQVHGDTVLTVETGREMIPECDGLVTENRSLRLGIYTADCAAICFGDGKKVGVVHAGWRGLCAGIIEKGLELFDHNTVEVYVGPHLHIFPIQKDQCYDAIVAKFGDRFLSEEGGEIVFHFRDAVASCLPPHAIFDGRSTGTDLTLPSWRRDRTNARIITVVGFR